MTGRPGELKERVATALQGAFKSREVLEAELLPEERPVNDDYLELDQWASLIDRQGVLLAYLSVVPETRAELAATMPDLLERAPAWLEAIERGGAVTLEVFARGLLETVTIQRREFERVVAEQTHDREPIQRRFARPLVDEAMAGRNPPEFLAAVIDATNVHSHALLEIAADLEATGRTDDLGTWGPWG